MLNPSELRRSSKSWPAGSWFDGSSHDEKLSQFQAQKDIGPLLDFLLDDDRPTVIIEENGRRPMIVFRNPAFNGLMDRLAGQEAFEEWLQQLLQSDPFVQTVGDFCGKSWHSKPFRHAWRIMHCREEQPESGPPGRRFSVSSQQSTWGDIVEGGRKLIDWTRSTETSPNPWIQFIKNYRWENTDLGPIKNWPEELRRLAVLIMACPDPRMIYWGNGQAIVYNEAAAGIIGHKHPAIMGTRFIDVWGEEIHARHMELVRHAIFEGRSDQTYDFNAILERDDLTQETYWNIHLLPVPGPKGYTIAVLNEYTESTSAFFNEQRRKILANISDHTSLAENLTDLWKTFLHDLDGNLGDCLYVSIYAADPGLQENYHFEGSIGAGSELFAPTIGMGDLTSLPSLADSFRQAKEAQQVISVTKQDGTLPPDLAIDTVISACILPITSMSGQQLAFVCFGLNPQRPFDQEMSLFVGHVRDLVSKFAAVISLPEEQRQSRRFEELNLALTQQLRITALKAEKSEETFMVRNLFYLRISLGRC